MEKFIDIISSRGLLIVLAIILATIKLGMNTYDNNGFSLQDLGISAIWVFTIYCVLKFALGFMKGYITGKRS